MNQKTNIGLASAKNAVIDVLSGRGRKARFATEVVGGAAAIQDRQG